MGYPVRPSGYVGWGSTGMTNIAEPTDAQKAYGWATNQQPPSSYFNWIQSKQDEWIQYLAWRTRLDTVVDTDFNDYPDPRIQTHAGGPVTGSGYWPMWNKTPTHAYGGLLGYVYLGFDFLAAGNAPSYVAYINKQADLPQYGEDFLLDAMVYYAGGVSRAEMSVGFPSYMCFVATGESGFFGVRIVPSGAAATSIGVSSYTSSGYTRLTLEGRGATMIVLNNGAQLYAMPKPVFLDFGNQRQFFGMYLKNASGVGGNVTAQIEKLTFKIGRAT